MADQGAPQTAKESKSKGFHNRLKKMFGRGTPPSRSTSSQAGVTPPVVASPLAAVPRHATIGVSPMPTGQPAVAPPTMPAPRAVVIPPANRLPPADHVPTASTITTDSEKAARLRAKYTHFRILVIGRANAGKTTLLKRVCNTKEDPVYSEVRYVRFALYPALIIPSPTD